MAVGASIKRKREKLNSIFMFMFHFGENILMYPFLIHNRAVFMTATGSYIMESGSSKNECQFFVYSSRFSGSMYNKIDDMHMTKL